MVPTKKNMVQINLMSGKFFLTFLVFFVSIFVYHLNFPHFLKLLFLLQYAEIFASSEVFAKKYRQNFCRQIFSMSNFNIRIFPFRFSSSNHTTASNTPKDTIKQRVKEIILHIAVVIVVVIIFSGMLFRIRISFSSPVLISSTDCLTLSSYLSPS